MAFDHPLAADQVDDLGLFSSFVRAPVVGVLMWALGGDEAKKKQQQEEEERLRQQQLFQSNTSGDHESTPEQQQQQQVVDSKPILHATQLQKMIEHNRNKKLGKKMPPRLVGSDLSGFGDLGISGDDLVDEDDDNDGSHSSYGLQRTKKMSWSDESGKNLCEVIDETSTLHEPQHNGTASVSPAPSAVKSSVKRSRSMRSHQNCLAKVSDQPIRYLPKGLSSGHGGIIMPTHPNATNAAVVSASGSFPNNVSPEGWGWYITTTPPTPDMYHHHSSNKQAKKSALHNAATTSKRALTNPAFKTTAQHTAIGWPSVPL